MRIDTAARTLRRADAAYRHDFTLMITSPGGPLEGEALGAMHAFQDTMDHALICANRACQGRRYLEGRGVADLPEISQAQLIRSLRDLQEHWTEWLPRRDPVSIDEKPWLKTRSAGKRLEAVAPEIWEGMSSGNADDGLLKWQGIDVPRLIRELETLSDVVGEASNNAPLHPSLVAFDQSHTSEE